MRTVPEIFDALGGPLEVARILDVKNSTATEMKRNESIGVQYWRALVDHAKSKKIAWITIEELHDITADTIKKRKDAKAKASK